MTLRQLIPMLLLVSLQARAASDAFMSGTAPIGAHEQQDDPHYQVMKMHSTSESAAKAAYIGQAMLKAEQNAWQTPEISRSPDKIAEQVVIAQTRASKEADSESWRNGAIEKSLKMAVTAATIGLGIEVPVVAPATPLLKEAGNLMVEGGLNSLSPAAVDTVTTSDKTAETLAKMSHRGAADNSPLSKLYRDVLVKRLNEDPRLISESAAPYQAFLGQQQQDKMSAVLDHLDENESKYLKEAKNAEEFRGRFEKVVNARFNRLTRDTQEAIAEAKANHAKLDKIDSKLSPTEKVEEAKGLVLRDEVVNGLSALSQGAILLKNPKLASQLDKGSQLAKVVFDIRSGLKTLTDNPAMMANSTLLAMNLANSLLGASGKSESAQIMEGIAALKVAIFDLKKAMLEAFDKLNLKLDRYFTESFARMDALQAGNELSIGQLNAIVANLHLMRGEINDGFYSLANLTLPQTLTKCLATNSVTGKAQSDISESEFQACQNILTSISTGDIASAVVAKSGEHEKLPPDLLKYLNSNFANTYKQEFVLKNPIHPGIWLAAARSLERLARLHPQFVSGLDSYGSEKLGFENDSVKESARSNGFAPALPEVRAAGDLMWRFLYQLAVDSKKHLRAQLFKKLLDNYKTTVRSAILNTQNQIVENQHKGPRPGLPLEKAEFTATDQDDFLKQSLSICPNAKATLGPIAHNGQGGAFFERILAFDYRYVVMSPVYAKYFPTSVLIASRATEQSKTDSDKVHDWNKVKIGGCFETWSVPSVDFAAPRNTPRTNGYITVELAVVLKLFFTYEDADHNVVTVPVQRLSGSVSATTPYFDAQWGIPFSSGMWSSATLGDDGPKIGTRFGEKPETWLKASGPLDPNGLAQFEDIYREQLNALTANIATSIEASPAEQDESVLARNSLLFLLELIQGPNGNVTRFHNWLSDETHFAPAKKWQMILLNNPVSPQDLINKLNEDVKAAQLFVDALSTAELQPLEYANLATELAVLNDLEKQVAKGGLQTGLLQRGWRYLTGK